MLSYPVRNSKNFLGPKEFFTFLEEFDATVNRDKSISDVQKFTYLKGFHTGSAPATAKGLPLAERNYGEALGLLKEKYGNKQVIVNSHMRTITSEKDTKQMSQLYDQI